MAKYQNDIHQVLRQVNQGNTLYFNELQDSEERRKALSPFVVFHFLAGARDHRAAHVVMTNDQVNPYLFSLSQHPLLLYKLMTSANCGIGDNDQYQFSKPRQDTITITERLIARHFGCSIREARDIMTLIDKKELDQIKDMYA